MLVTFSCAVTSIIVRMLNGVCQIVVEKKKKESVGEHLLPMCKIVLSELKRFEGRVLSFIGAQNIIERMLPLDSDKEVLQILVHDPEKAEMFEGSQALAHFRNQLLQITNVNAHWEVSMKRYYMKLL